MSTIKRLSYVALNLGERETHRCYQLLEEGWAWLQTLDHPGLAQREDSRPDCLHLTCFYNRSLNDGPDLSFWTSFLNHPEQPVITCQSLATFPGYISFLLASLSSRGISEHMNSPPHISLSKNDEAEWKFSKELAQLLNQENYRVVSAFEFPETSSVFCCCSLIEVDFNGLLRQGCLFKLRSPLLVEWARWDFFSRSLKSPRNNK